MATPEAPTPHQEGEPKKEGEPKQKPQQQGPQHHGEQHLHAQQQQQRAGQSQSAHNNDAPDDGQPRHRKRRRSRHRHRNAQNKKQTTGRGRFLAFLIAGVVVLISAGVVVTLLLMHKHKLAEQAAARDKKTDQGPEVKVVKSMSNAGSRQVTYPGEVRGLKQASLYAKSNGYIRDMKVDKGDRVVFDQVLATVEAPETDQQLAGARSSLILRKQEYERNEVLQKQGVVSEEDRETSEANLRAAQAEVNRLSALKGYETIKAPFTGVITARYVDPGALIPASTGATSGSPILDIAQTDTLRILFNVGQDVAQFVKIGDMGTFYADEQPGILYTGTVTRTSSALDPRTRTLLVEIDYDNKESNILPGTFVHVSLKVTAPELPTVPNDSVITRDGRNYVAVIDQDRKAHFVAVELGLNDGRSSQITRGLKGGETVAEDFPLELSDGATVQPKMKDEKKGAAQAGGVPDTPRSGATTGDVGAGKPSAGAGGQAAVGGDPNAPSDQPGAQAVAGLKPGAMGAEGGAGKNNAKPNDSKDKKDKNADKKAK